MKTLKMYELLKKRVLVTRGSARLIEGDLSSALSEGEREVIMDFIGIEGVTPSFLDETLSILEENVPRTNGRQFRIFIENSPTHLSSKFEAVGRGHGLEIHEVNEKSWVISKVGENI